MDGYPVKIYAMNYFSSIYIALEVTDPNPFIGAGFGLDDNVYGVYDDMAVYYVRVHEYFDFSGAGLIDAHQDGTMAFSISAGKNVFERSKPRADDPEDFSINPFNPSAMVWEELFVSGSAQSML
jgi:hypothetical protein